ncbi:unnamed protein product [Withania somnifera]
MRRDVCDGVGIARLLNATLVLPKFEVAAYWNESSGFEDVFDVDFFIQQMKGFVNVVKELPIEIVSKDPVRVDCSKRKGQFDYVESVLPSLLKHGYISITPAMSQRRDSALRLTSTLEKKALELLQAIPKPFLSLHLRFEPDMVAYSQCENRGKCPLTPAETAFILYALAIPTNTTIYLAAGDGLMELAGLASVFTNVVTKSSLLSGEDFTTMHGNTKAALDYYVSIYMATYLGNMDKMVAAMRAFKGLYETIFLNRKAFAVFTSQGLKG